MPNDRPPCAGPVRAIATFAVVALAVGALPVAAIVFRGADADARFQFGRALAYGLLVLVGLGVPGWRFFVVPRPSFRAGAEVGGGVTFVAAVVAGVLAYRTAHHVLLVVENAGFAGLLALACMVVPLMSMFAVLAAVANAVAGGLLASQPGARATE